MHVYVTSPLAKKLATEGIDLNYKVWTGDSSDNERDIDNFNPQNGRNTQSFTPIGSESITEIANSQMRKTIAKRLSASKFSAPHYYLA